MNGWFDDMERTHDAMAKLFDEVMMGRPHHTALPGQKGKCLCRRPITDLYENKNNVVARIELPGVEKKDIHLDVVDNAIELKVEKKDEVEQEDKERGYYRFESRCTNFFRRIPLPQHVQPENVIAKFENGILNLQIPKQKKQEHRKHIDIK